MLEENGYDFVCVEGDWPDCYYVNSYLHATPPPMEEQHEKAVDKAEQALKHFERFPTWMWRNTVIRDFIRNCRRYNDRIKAGGAASGASGATEYRPDICFLLGRSRLIVLPSWMR